MRLRSAPLGRTSATSRTGCLGDRPPLWPRIQFHVYLLYLLSEVSRSNGPKSASLVRWFNHLFHLGSALIPYRNHFSSRFGCLRSVLPSKGTAGGRTTSIPAPALAELRAQTPLCHRGTLLPRDHDLRQNECRGNLVQSHDAGAVRLLPANYASVLHLGLLPLESSPALRIVSLLHPALRVQPNRRCL